MFPDQQNQSGGQPSAPYQPPQTPAYGVNSAPQQAPNGQYQVVPPPSITGRATGHNPYEFIVNPNTPQKSSGLFGGNSFIRQVVVLISGAVLLMIIAAIVITVLSPKKDNGASLTALAQRQQEIIRVATLGTTKAVSSDTQNFATNVELAVSSNQNQLLAYLASSGTKLGTKQLSIDRSLQTDKLLADASATSTFDIALKQNLTTQLTGYENNLRTAYEQTSKPKTKQIIQNSFDAAAKLLEQAKSMAAS
jgi:hypothetical protein